MAQLQHGPAAPGASAQRVPDGEYDAPRVAATDLDTERIRRIPVLGGLINQYTYAA